MAVYLYVWKTFYIFPLMPVSVYDQAMKTDFNFETLNTQGQAPR